MVRAVRKRRTGRYECQGWIVQSGHLVFWNGGSGDVERGSGCPYWLGIIPVCRLIYEDGPETSYPVIPFFDRIHLPIQCNHSPFIVLTDV